MFFCNHDWKLVSEKLTKSKVEVASAALGYPSSLPWQLACAQRKYIQIVACEKCGKLKRFVEDI